MRNVLCINPSCTESDFLPAPPLCSVVNCIVLAKCSIANFMFLRLFRAQDGCTCTDRKKEERLRCHAAFARCNCNCNALHVQSDYSSTDDTKRKTFTVKKVVNKLYICMYLCITALILHTNCATENCRLSRRSKSAPLCCVVRNIAESYTTQQEISV